MIPSPSDRTGINLVAYSPAASQEFGRALSWAGLRKYQIVSLWDMLEFQAAVFVSALRNITDAEWKLSHHRNQMLDAERLDEELIGVISTSLLAVADECKTLGLKMTEMSARRLIGDMPCYTKGFVANALNEIHERMQDELMSLLFMFMPADKVPLYRDEFPFGEQVANAFPGSVCDIAEASKCLAMARYTACVLHLMRVMEAGVRAFAHRLRVPEKAVWNKPWGVVMARLDDKIKKISEKNPASKRRREAMMDLWLCLDAVRIAWRNPSMHPTKTTYTEEEAKRVFESTKTYIQRLTFLL